MLFNLSNEYDVPKFIEYAKKLMEAGAVVELKKKSELKTSSQNRYLHLLCGWLGMEIGMSLDEVKIDFFKRTCNKEIFVRTHVNKFGKEVPYLRSVADLTKEECTTAIERFRNWSASEAGVYLPSADERSFLNHIEAEMQRQKDFI